MEQCRKLVHGRVPGSMSVRPLYPAARADKGKVTVRGRNRLAAFRCRVAVWVVSLPATKATKRRNEAGRIEAPSRTGLMTRRLTLPESAMRRVRPPPLAFRQRNGL